MKHMLRCFLNFLLATLVASQNTYSSVGTSTVAPPVTTTNTAVTSTSATSTSDDPYKAIILALTCEAIAMQKIACANRNTKNPGFFLQVATSIDNDYFVLLALGNGTSVGGGDGATCLAFNSQLSLDINQCIQHANDTGCPGNLSCAITDGLSGGGLTGEAYYKCVLQELGRDIAAMFNAAGTATGTGGPYQQLIVKITKDTSVLQNVVANHDSSQNCINASTEFGIGMQRLFAFGAGAYVCPNGNGVGATTTVASITTVAVGGSGSGYGR